MGRANVDAVRHRLPALAAVCVVAAAGQGLGTVLSDRVLGLLSLAPLPALAVGVTAHAGGLALVALAALAVSDHRPTLRVPDTPSRRLALGAAGGLATVRLLAVLVLAVVGVPFAGNAVTSLADAGVRVSLVVLMVLSVVVVAPAEELLFRGVVQRGLASVVSRPAAVAGSSLLFALAHVQTTWAHTPEPAAVGVTLLAIFGVSLVFGGTYALTRNLAVPVVVHGLYNVAVLGVLYVGLP